jgi:predicted N-acetyltransferase YhbS
MKISRVDATEHADFLQLVNAEIRPDRAKTTAWDDFPLILSPENREFQLVCRAPDGRMAGCIAALCREFITSCGPLAVAGIGSVVTHPDFRGKGLSSALQNEMLALLEGKNIPLAVLWSDQPEIYAGRGFQPAGWEIHAEIPETLQQVVPQAGETIREYREEDLAVVESLYSRHPLHTCREEGDSRTLYGMPGTAGLVLCGPDGVPRAALFSGKGADFPQYVTEWNGPHDQVLALLGEVSRRGWAKRVLLPPGEEVLVNHLVDRGAGWVCLPSGLWKIVCAGPLEEVVAAAGRPIPDDTASAEAWLGTVGEDGQPLVGPLSIAVWGFDSV